MKRMIFCLLTAVAAPLAMAQQTLAPPPVKMGLWETRTTVKMTGVQLPPAVVAKLQAQGKPIPGNEPRKKLSHMCLTAATWHNEFENLEPGREKSECPMKILKQDSSGMVADFVCNASAPGDKRTGHIEIKYASAEKWNGTMRTEIVTAAHPAPMLVNMSVDSVYLGADCQGIAPGASRDLPMK